jgi:hypothetical protein
MTTHPVLLALAAVSQAGADATPAWKPYTSDAGAFSVLLPGSPTESTRVAHLADARLELRVLAKKRGLGTFAVAFGEFPDGSATDPDRLLDVARDELVQAMKGRPVGEAKVEVGGHPGRDLRIDIPSSVAPGGASVRARIVLVARRLYELSAVVQASRATESAREVDAFLASFAPNGADAAVVRASAPEGVPAPKRSPATKVPAIRLRPGWQVFSAEEGRFAVAFPGRPETTARSVDSPSGPIEVRTVSLTQPTGEEVNRVYLVTYTDDPSSTKKRADEVFDAMRAASLRQAPDARLMNQQAIRLGPYPGREVMLDLALSGAVMRIRYYLVDGRAFQQIYLGLAGEAEGDEAAAFFDSFRVLPPQ